MVKMYYDQDANLELLADKVIAVLVMEARVMPRPRI